MRLRILLLSRLPKMKTGLNWAIILGMLVFLTSANAFRNNRSPTEAVKRESRRLRSGHLSFNHNQSPMSPLNPNFNRMNLGFNHHPMSGPPPRGNNHYHNNDLSASAQTLYDLRGFHIPLAGQEETQRFLRQQNQLQLDHQTTPLVFPSFFQPQQPQRHETQQPQAINIFGHNQHHQQTHRFRPPEQDNTFRPSQPDLGVTTTTENVFRPVQPAGLQVQGQEQQRPTQQQPQPANAEEEIYVYDDTDYQLEQDNLPVQQEKPAEEQLKIKNNVVETNNRNRIVETAPEPEILDQQRFRLRELPPVSHNPFFNNQVQDSSKDNRFDVFESHNDNDISSPPPRPNVEIVPSSERKPPEHINTIFPSISPNPDNILIFQNENRKNKSPLRLSRPQVQPQELPVQQFPTLHEEPVRFVQPQNLNAIGFQRNRFPSFNQINRQRPEQQIQDVPREVESEKFFQNDPIQFQKLNPIVIDDRFRRPQQIRPTVNTIIPQVEDEPQYFDDEKYEIQQVEEVTTTQPPTTTTTEAPRKTELKHIRPFSSRTRPTPPTTTTTATTTQIPKRRITRPPRIRPSKETEIRTTTILPVKLVKAEYFESREVVETARQSPTRPAPTIRSRGSPIIRQRITEAPTTSPPIVEEELKPVRTLQRQNQFQFEQPIQQDDYQSNPPPNFNRRPLVQFNPPPPPRFQTFQNDFGQQFHVINDNFPPHPFPVQPEQRFPQLIRQHQPRFQPPPPPMVAGKPLYITGKMLGKEGGLYAGQAIPQGHIYGSPIPLIPMKTVFERVPPGIIEGQSVSQRRPSISRQRPSISQTTEERREKPQRITSTGQERGEKSKTTSVIRPTQRTRPRPPLRRKFRPATPTQQSQQRQQIQEQRDSTETSRRESETEVSLTVNEVTPTAPPPKIIRRRPKRPRVIPINSQAGEEQNESRPTPSSPKIRARIRPRQQRPASLVTSQPQISETTQSSVITQSSVQIFRKPTEAPGRFSSRFRDENILPTPAPTSPSVQTIKPQELSERRVVKVKKNLNLKAEAVTTFAPPKPKATKIRQNDSPEDESGLPPSIFLSPKDVITNRKPARRIPPGSYSDRIKALQARRKNLKSRVGQPVRVAPTKQVQHQAENDSEDEEDEVYSQSSNIEQVQNKREIHSRYNKALSSLKSQNEVPAVPELKVDLTGENSTEATSEETMSLLGIPRKSSKENEKSQMDPPHLISLEDEEEDFDDDNTETDSDSQPLIGGNPNFPQPFINSNLKQSTKSPFNIFTMSTEEPSLPLEAYFPIVSQQ